MANTCSSWLKLLVVAFLIFLSCDFLYARSESEEIPVFAPVNDWLYRGGQPREEGFDKLKSKGIRTVVNFRDEPKWIEWERKQVESRGMKYVSLPWNITRSVKPELSDQLFEVLDDPKNRPVFMHCKHGRDRTGVMSTLALMRYENLSEKEAKEEAIGTIRPHLRYLYFVHQKIKALGDGPAGDRHLEDSPS